MTADKKITTEADALEAIANALCDDWSIGSFSCFCDEPADFDAAKEVEIMADIRATLAKIGWCLQPV